MGFLLTTLALAHATVSAFMRSQLRWIAPLCAVFLGLPSAGAGHTIPVAGSADLQPALDRANPGDTLVLTPGVRYVGNFWLRAKPVSSNDWITLTTAQPDRLPPNGTRLTPTLASALPKLITPNNMRALEAEPGAHHYRLIGLELAPAPGVYSLGLLALGQTDNPKPAGVPHDFVLEHLYVHGDPKAGGKYGIRLEAAQVSLSDSTIADIKSDSQDSQAVTGCNGPGPFTLVNNFLEAAGENVMWGACGTLPGVVPSDIVMRGNHLFKPLSWKGSKWQVKNSFEIKNGQRIKLIGNVFENNWANAQPGLMIQLTPRALDNGKPGIVRDILFESNVFENSPSGVNISGHDDLAKNSGETRQIVFRNNLFIGFGDPSSAPKLFQIQGPIRDLVLDHNTGLTTNGSWLSIDTPIPGAQVTNNILSHADYGIFGPEVPFDGPAIQRYLPQAPVRGNVVVGGSPNKFPDGNFLARDLDALKFDRQQSAFPYALGPSSSFRRKATDGTDPGAALPVLLAAAEKAVSGRP